MVTVYALRSYLNSIKDIRSAALPCAQNLCFLFHSLRIRSDSTYIAWWIEDNCIGYIFVRHHSAVRLQLLDYLSFTVVILCLASVGGDMAKVRYVPGLSDVPHLLLKNIGHTVRKLAGTQETRRLMRFITQAYRIRYGTVIFVIFFHRM